MRYTQHHDPSGTRTTMASRLLLTAGEVRAALGLQARVEVGAGASPPAPGEVLRAAATDSAYRRFTGTSSSGEVTHPLAVSILVLVFDAEDKALRTFSQVAQAAHLRAPVDGCDVAVETVTAPSGLISYWGFVHRAEVIEVITLDTLDPQQLSIADLRSLVTLAATKLIGSRA